MPSNQAKMRRIRDGREPLPPYDQLHGHRLVRLEPGHCVFEADADANQHANPTGTVHGGYVMGLADSAMGLGYSATVEEPEATCTNLDFRINFLRPTFQGTLRAEATLLHGGRTMGVMECRVTNDQDKLVAHATSTFLTLRDDQAQGR